MPRAPHLLTGEWGEDLAVKCLRAKKYRILGRRVRIGRGEIDIVARDGEQLVFVEVKARATAKEGRPAEAVNYRKRRLLAQSGMRYISRMRHAVTSYRFDIVEVVGNRNDPSPAVTHIVRAFDRRGRWR